MSNKATDGIKQTNSSLEAFKKSSQMGMTITSGYRSPSKNGSIGGSKTSFHMTGQAYDVAGTTSQMQSFAEWAKTSGLFTEVIYNNTDHADHVHVGWGSKTPYYDVKNSSSTGNADKVSGAPVTGIGTSETITGGGVSTEIIAGVIRFVAILVLIVFAFSFFLMAFPKVDQVAKMGGKLLK